MSFSDAIRQLEATCFEPIISASGKVLLGIKDRTGNTLNHPTEGEIILLAEGLTVAMIHANRRRDLKVRAHSA